MKQGNFTFCYVITLGEIPFADARTFQESLAAKIADGIQPPTLLLLEHPHTFTFGRRGQEENLLWNREELAARNIEIHWIDRGGDVTYHGPGQLVGYPLLPLGKLNSSGRLPQADYVGYVRRLEEVLIQSLAKLELASTQIADLPGVWVQPDVASRSPRCPPAARKTPSKIAAIGVKVDALGVSRHGFALNVDPDMSYWEGIVACGLVDHPSIALADLLDPIPSMASVQDAVIETFGEVFGCEMRRQAASM
ncbi:MAG: octanoyltransferase [Anaerolineales bacterium]|nr:octanoyltransferase [Anaerolineales bacterium]